MNYLFFYVRPCLESSRRFGTGFTRRVLTRGLLSTSGRLTTPVLFNNLLGSLLVHEGLVGGPQVGPLFLIVSLSVLTSWEGREVLVCLSNPSTLTGSPLFCSSARFYKP